MDVEEMTTQARLEQAAQDVELITAECCDEEEDSQDDAELALNLETALSLLMEAGEVLRAVQTGPAPRKSHVDTVVYSIGEFISSMDYGEGDI